MEKNNIKNKKESSIPNPLSNQLDNMNRLSVKGQKKEKKQVE